MSNFGGSGAKPYTITADGLAGVAGKGRLVGVTLDHTAATTVTLYDNASAASGTKLATVRITADGQLHRDFTDEGVEFSNGCYVDWTAGTVTVYVKQ